MKHNQTPDWRWIRARRLADNNLTPSRSRDDRFIQQAWRFIKRLRKLDIRAEERLANDYPKLFEAFKVYDDTQSGTRWVFEASVMANRPVAELAQYLRTDVEMLELYEKLFFDVRDALENRGCIISNVLMPVMTNSVSSRDPDIFWKAIAYFGGWEAVRSSWEIGHASPEAIDFFNKANRQKMIKNAYDALHTLQLHSMNAHEAIKAVQEQRRLDHETETPSAGDPTHESMGALLTSMQITVTPARAKLPQEEPRLQQPLLPDTVREAEVEVIDDGKKP
jgi:hypothetical protein